MNRSAAPDSHLTDRQLDDFVAGRLRGPERTAVLAHLDHCSSCFDLYADVADAQEESTPVPQSASPLRPWLAIAAVLIAGIACWWLLTSTTPLGSNPTTAELIATAEPEQLAAGLTSRPAWDGQRDPDLLRLDPRQLAFRLGVVAAQLDVALATNNGDAALELTEQQQLPLVAAWTQGGLVEPIYLEIAAQLRAGEAPETLLGDAAQAAVHLDRWLEGAYRIGVWAEAGRLAAGAGLQRFFRSSAGEPPAAELDTDLDPDARPAFERAAEAAGQVQTGSDLGPVTRAFEELVSRGGGSSGRPPPSR